MRRAIGIVVVSVFAATGMLTACGLPDDAAQPQVQRSADEAIMMPAAQDLQGMPEGLEEQPPPVKSSCFTTTCTPGLEGNQYCSQLCGDVAKCVPAGWYGCGLRPCCVLM